MLVAIMSLAVGSIAGGQPGDNLIRNGGFEEQSVRSWRLDGAEIDKGNLHQGKQCVKITGAGVGYQGALYNPVGTLRVHPAGKYQLVFWLKLQKESGYFKVRVRQRRGKEDLAGQGYYEFQPPESVDWKPYSYEFLAALEADNILLDFYFINTRGIACLDDISLRQIGTVEPLSSDKLTEELRKKLDEAGYKTSEEPDYLVTEKDGLRTFHRRIKGKLYLTRGEWEKEVAAVSEAEKLNYHMESFPIGPAIYGYALYERAQQLGMEKGEYISKILDDMKAHHMTTLWYGNTGTDREDIEKMVTLCEERGLKLVLQMSGAYYCCTEEEYRNDPEKRRKHFEEVNRPFVTEIIPKYRNRKGVFAWSVKEETKAEYAKELAAYYKLVGELDPTHPILICHNNLEAAERMEKPYPSIMGFDRYYYRASLSGGGYLRTPALAASLLAEEIPPFYQASLRYRIPFFYVIQGVSTYMTGMDFSKEGTVGANMQARGWRPDPGGKMWSGWLRYYPPKHCMKLQVWTAVALGAKGIFSYYYGESVWGKMKWDGRSEMEFALSRDTSGQPSPQWEEFGEAAKDISYFAPLILKINKRIVSLAGSDDPHILVSTFQEEDTHRKYLIVVNKRTGSWGKDSPKWLKPEDDLTVDEQGNLAGYSPAPPLEFVLKLQCGGDLYNLRSFKKLDAVSSTGGERSYRMVLPPGEGNIFLVGAQEDLSECKRDFSSQ